MDSVQWLGVAVLAGTAALALIRTIVLGHEKRKRFMREVRKHERTER